jgi:hypothetical protein
MKTNKQTKERRSMYWMLVRSQENARPFFEVVIYTLIALSAVAAILQFAQQPDPLPFIVLPGAGPSA